VSFEDLYGGPFYYNDLSFSFSNTVGAATVPVPEPASWALMLAGLGSVGVVGSRRKAQR